MAFPSFLFRNTYWRITDGDIYVSYLGSNTGWGLGTPTNPYKTIQHAINQASTGARIIVGTGEYNEKVNGLAKNCKIIADGTVMSKGSAMSSAFTNMGSSSIIQGFTITDHKYAVDGVVSEIKNCFITSSFVNFNGTIRFSVLSNITVAGSSPIRFINCTLIGVTSTVSSAITRLENCHFDGTTSLQLNTSALIYFDYCNQFPGSSIQINGVPLNTPAAVTAAHSGFQVNGLSVNPQFNQPSIGDYTLAKGSPLRFTGSKKLPIGAFGEAVKVGVQQMMSGTITGVVINSNNFFELPESVLLGVIETPIIDLGYVRPVRAIHLYADQVLDESTYRYVSYLNDARVPGALTVEMRYADVQGNVSQTAYHPMIWDKVVSHDNAQRGNGELNFRVRDESFITTRFVQFRITMRNAEELILLAQENYHEVLQQDERQIQV